MPINPAFMRYPVEAGIVGHLLAAFGELEVTTCFNAAKATGLQGTLTALYRIRATSSRIETADALMRPLYSEAGLEAGHSDALRRVRHCLRIRNQFAHCNWADDSESVEAGLFFVDLTVSAETPNFEHAWKHTDAALLQSHEAYFDAALEALRFMDHEMAVFQKKLESHYWPKPLMLTPPPLHNPEGLHIPPWLTEDEKARHIARTEAALGGAPTPTPAQIALEKARSDKRARRQVDRDRDLAKRSDPESQPS